MREKEKHMKLRKQGADKLHSDDAGSLTMIHGSNLRFGMCRTPTCRPLLFSSHAGGVTQRSRVRGSMLSVSWLLSGWCPPACFRMYDAVRMGQVRR